MTPFFRLTHLGWLVAVLALGACGPGTPSSYQGWIEADLVFVAPDETGRVDIMNVREGDTVAAGAALFALDAELQQADARAAEAAGREARARLERLEAAQQRPAEIAVLEAQERRADAALALSAAQLERQKSLAQKGFTPQAQLDTAQANYDRDRAALEEVRRQIQFGRMTAHPDDIAAARQTLAAAESRLKSAETKLARRRVAAPAAGVIQQIYYRPGETVPPGRPVLALLPPGNVKVRFYVPETALPKVGIGEMVAVRCDGCAEGITARISFIARTAEFTPPVIYSLEERAKLVFLVEARPDKPEALRVGQPVTVTPAPAAAVAAREHPR